jgi:hypothetical protein
MGFQNIGKFAAKIANGVDVANTFTGTAMDMTGDIVAEKASHGIRKLSGNVLFNENVQGVGRKIAFGINDSANRIGKGIGGGAEGMIIGASTGATIGGISGAIDEDETFLEGAAKGALGGAALGGAVGTTSGALHKNAGLFANTGDDIKNIKAVASKISKWGARDGNGIVVDNIRTTGTTYSM